MQPFPHTLVSQRRRAFATLRMRLGKREILDEVEHLQDNQKAGVATISVRHYLGMPFTFLRKRRSRSTEYTFKR
jgi:hypothetical protein